MRQCVLVLMTMMLACVLLGCGGGEQPEAPQPTPAPEPSPLATMDFEGGLEETVSEPVEPIDAVEGETAGDEGE